MVQETAFYSQFNERTSLGEGSRHQSGDFRIAESRYEHSGEGRRLHQMLKGLLAVRLDAGDTLICENECGFRKELDRIEQAGGDDRLEVIGLELPLQGSQRYGGIIAHDREGYLLHHHGEHGIDLRSEERRVGKECDCKCRCRWWP